MKNHKLKKIGINFSVALLASSYMGYSGNVDINTPSNSALQEEKNTRVEVLDLHKDMDGGYFYFPLPEQVVDYLLKVQNKVKQNFTLNDNISSWRSQFHITLISPQRVSHAEMENLSKDFKNIFSNQSKLVMEFEPVLGTLPRFQEDPKWPEVLVIKVKKTPEITEFYEKVISVLKNNLSGFKDYDKEYNQIYTPHITLGYFKKSLSSTVKANILNDLPHLLQDFNEKNNGWFAKEFEFEISIHTGTPQEDWLDKAAIRYHF